MNHYVKMVHALHDYRLELTFENGERRIFDLTPYLERGVFHCLKNRALFQAARMVAGSVEWPGEIDLSYDTLYLESPIPGLKGFGVGKGQIAGETENFK